jgi:hypothetical protein
MKKTRKSSKDDSEFYENKGWQTTFEKKHQKMKK